MRLTPGFCLVWATMAHGCALGAPPAHVHPRAGMMNVGDAVLRYELRGEGDAVVLVHGWANTLEIWNDQVQALEQSFRVLRYDRRGFGRSTGHADISADPDDLRILMDSLGVASAHVVGLSAGSQVATRFAFAFPRRTRSLVRLSGPPPVGMPGMLPTDTANPARLAALWRAHGKDSVYAVVLSRVGYIPSDETAAERERRLRRHSTWDYSGQDLLDPRPQSGRVPPVQWNRIRELTVPTLLVNGAHDNPRALMAADSLAAHLPDARLVVIPRAGHAANVDAPGRFNRELIAFLKSVP